MRAEEPFSIIGIGASAGGVQAIGRLLAHLPRALPAALLVVTHGSVVPADNLAAVLAGRTELTVRPARDHDELRQGTCIVAPSDKLLWVGADRRTHLLSDGFYRAHRIDATFNSLAVNVRQAAVGVVMSGTLGDGALGLRAIKDAGGLAMVQSPEDAEFGDMLLNALAKAGKVDFVGTAEEFGPTICRLIADGATNAEVAAAS